jgi:hypothetical protein
MADQIEYIVIDHGPPPAPPNVQKLDLFDRLSMQQQAIVLASLNQARALTPAQVADPANQALAGLLIVDYKLGMVSAVDPTNPQTIQAAYVFAALGVFGTDQAAIQAAVALFLAP